MHDVVWHDGDVPLLHHGSSRGTMRAAIGCRVAWHARCDQDDVAETFRMNTLLLAAACGRVLQAPAPHAPPTCGEVKQTLPKTREQLGVSLIIQTAWNDVHLAVSGWCTILTSSRPMPRPARWQMT